MARDHNFDVKSRSVIVQCLVGRSCHLCLVLIVLSVSLFWSRYTLSEILPQKLRELQRTADQGDDYAQAELGRMYYLGEGVPRDLKVAAQWYRKAADQGNDYAQARLGRMYYSGEGVPRDLKVAAQWYRKAADQGDDYAQAGLGAMYYSGEGVPKGLFALLCLD